MTKFQVNNSAINICTVEYHTAWIQKYMYSGELHGMDLTIYVQWRITQHRFNNIRIVENYTSWIQQYNIRTVENYTAWIQQYTYSGEFHSMDSRLLDFQTD